MVLCYGLHNAGASFRLAFDRATESKLATVACMYCSACPMVRAGRLMQTCCLLSQEMGFNSIPFEEPELFAAMDEPHPKDWPADKQDNSLHLRLDSQDGLGNSFAEVGVLLRISCM